jgi:hypothetical protein
MHRTVKASLLVLSIMMCFGVFVYFAGCSSDDSTDAGGGGGGSAAIDDLITKYGCASSPTDTCSQSVCSLLQSAKASAAYSGVAECVGTLATCWSDACPADGGMDSAAMQVCISDYYTCICAVPEVKSALGTYCSQYGG